ncbi:hypothetical protein ACGFIW_27030 [Micromonospora sp. NPDC048935]|uniref:AfsR/SARP family transcriptional regulator n=1 Tax=Micromonospora sp. NPDC048935 TaxID=3364262 RepID=UPI0037239E72
MSVDRLVDVVWGEQPPATVANTLQRHVSYLRGVLGEPGSIVARQPGHVLDTGPGSTDVQAARPHLIRSAVVPAGSGVQGVAGRPAVHRSIVRGEPARVQVAPPARDGGHGGPPGRIGLE